MKSATWVQIQGKVACVSLRANALEKGMDPFSLSPKFGYVFTQHIHLE